jgi:hypothetical protein
MSNTESSQKTKPKMTRQDRRRLLRSVLLAGGVFGAALSGYLPLAYARKSACARPARWMKRIFLGSVASNVANACRCVRCRPSSWPTWSMALV